MISRVLVPLDGSRQAEGALPHAAAIASAFSADLVLHRVAVASTDDAPVFVAPFECDLIRHQAQRYLTRIADRLANEGHTVTTKVADGKPIDAMLHAVEELDIDLVVVAGDGHGTEARGYLAGAVWQLVSAGACSVLVVRQAGHQPEGAVYRRVGSLVDGSQRSEWAACLAAAVARSQGVGLSLLHVVPAPEMPRRRPLAAHELSLQAMVTAANRSVAEGHLNELRNRLTGPGAEVKVRIAEATRIAPALARLARDEGADLLVMSAHGWGCDHDTDDDRWPYGSVCESLLLHGSASLLVFQDLPPVPGWPATTAMDAVPNGLAPRRQVTAVKSP